MRRRLARAVQERRTYRHGHTERSGRVVGHLLLHGESDSGWSEAAEAKCSRRLQDRRAAATSAARSRHGRADRPDEDRDIGGAMILDAGGPPGGLTGWTAEVDVQLPP